MRHQIHGRQLNRTSSHRKAMLKNLAAALFEHGEIRTTMPKAKAVQPLVEKIITIAKKNNLHARRQIEQKINDRMIHQWVTSASEEKLDNPYFDLPDASEIEHNRYGEVRKAPRLVQHILTNVAPRYQDRAGGYTRIIKLAEHRLGDGADLVLLQLVGEEDGPDIGGGVSRRRAASYKRAEFAASLRKGKAATAEEEAPVAVEEEAPAEEAAPEAEAPAEDTEEKTEE